MTIRQQGGVFGRNPTFSNVTVDGILTVDQIVEKTSAAGITLDGVTLKDGNVVLANGKGIDFSATPGAGTSELFDDYEEGTYTPTLTPGTSGTITVNTASDVLLYTKVGRLATVSGRIGVSAVSSPVGVEVRLTLPFNVPEYDEDADRAGGAFKYYNGSNHLVGACDTLPGNNILRLYLDASTVTSSFTFGFSFTYAT